MSPTGPTGPTGQTAEFPVLAGDLVFVEGDHASTAEIKWVWKIVATGLGLVAGLAIPQLIKARAEDMQVDFRAVKRGLLVGGLLFGIALALVLPGGWLGKTTAGFGSWGGSLLWVLML